MVTLKPIPEGGVIRLVSPANFVTESEIQAGIHLLETEGFRVELGKSALGRHQTYGGTDQDRAADIMDAFLAPEVDAVICCRGGYGCARLVPYLDFDAIIESRKPFFGYSDITTIHMALNRRGLPTFYSPMVSSFQSERSAECRESFLRALKGTDPLATNLSRGTPLVGGTAKGISGGGCLTLLTDSLGTTNELDSQGKILFIEDVGEKPHRIDAYLTHFLLAGKLQCAAGIVIGEMTGTNELRDEAAGSPTWQEIVSERLGDLDIPVIVDFPFGHINDLLTIPLGIALQLNATSGVVSTLDLLE